MFTPMDEEVWINGTEPIGIHGMVRLPIQRLANGGEDFLFPVLQWAALNVN